MAENNLYGVIGIAGRQGPQGEKGATGAKLVSRVKTGETEAGDYIYVDTFDDGTTATWTSPKGADGAQGVTFTPSVSSAGIISWTNDGELPNPDSVNIKGPQGEVGPMPQLADNLITQSSTIALAARQGYLLGQRVDNLENIGKFLAIWNCTTGLPTSQPHQGVPYAYTTGDYFRVGAVDKEDDYEEYDPTETYNVGDKCIYSEAYYICNTENTTGEWDATKWTAHTIVNYKPAGDNYAGIASTTVETDTRISVGSVYYYDGADWVLQLAGSGGTVQDVTVNGVSVLASGIAAINDSALSEVKYAAQSLTSGQKTQARTNISAQEQIVIQFLDEND